MLIAPTGTCARVAFALALVGRVGVGAPVGVGAVVGVACGTGVAVGVTIGAIVALSWRWGPSSHQELRLAPLSQVRSLSRLQVALEPAWRWEPPLA